MALGGRTEGDGQGVRRLSEQRRLPYGRQSIEADDLAAVADVLQSDWLTTGPNVAAFERALAAVTGAKEAVAVNSGTAALHCAMHAAGIEPGDEVLVPAMTFAASSNAVLYCSGTPVFVDVEPDTLLIDVGDAADKVTPKTKAIVAVDYAGQPCDYPALRALCEKRGLKLIADACHAIGGSLHGAPVGSLADASTFSFHPVKHVTTGEGGAIATNDPEIAARMRTFRNHGITSDHREREQTGSWFYEMVELGFNYRITDFQCALGTSQLKKLPRWIERRQAIARRYDEAFAGHAKITPLVVRKGASHAYHLYVVRVPDRARVFAELREAGIGVNVHYVPVHLHPYYRKRFGFGPGLCPNAEAAYERILSLPMFPAMTDADVTRVVEVLERAVASTPVPSVPVPSPLVGEGTR